MVASSSSLSSITVTANSHISQETELSSGASTWKGCDDASLFKDVHLDHLKADWRDGIRGNLVVNAKTQLGTDHAEQNIEFRRVLHLAYFGGYSLTIISTSSSVYWETSLMHSLCTGVDKP